MSFFGQFARKLLGRLVGLKLSPSQPQRGTTSRLTRQDWNLESALLPAIPGMHGNETVQGSSEMTYLLWIALSCGLFWIIRLGIEARANYLRRERSEEHLEKLNSAIE